ncbi:MAG TPA: CBS domain-containing protein [Candidatus Krumholzibacteria bacterium]|nr:CBS domain-containing protein [Candidatus Krumholzibacteria bacterium]
MRIREVMTKNPVLVRRRATLHRAAQLMRDTDAGFLPVIGENGVIGVLTDRDVVVRAVADAVSPLTGYVEDVMSVGAITCEADEDIATVTDRMAREGCRRVVVVDTADLPIGVVSLGDLVREDGVNDHVTLLIHHVAGDRGDGNGSD